MRKFLEMESRVAVVNFKIGRVCLFGRQNMCDNIETSYHSLVMHKSLGRTHGRTETATAIRDSISNSFLVLCMDLD